MKILRISLKDYRGVTDRTIEFAPRGVTIVEGPNEIGKSSVAEAIDRVIEDLDSSGRDRVLAIKPVDRDVGPEVSIDVESGAYAFTYRKRFLRQPETELQVHRPVPEHHTGREAHARAEAILAETVDMALWKALRLQQGNQVGQAELANKASLSRALERAAGEVGAGEREVSLLGAARAAYLASWTESGKRRKDTQDLEATIAQATERAQVLEVALAATESDVDASDTLAARIEDLTEHLDALRAREEEHRARVDGLRSVESLVESVAQRHENAVLGANEARRIATARRELVVAVETARATASQRIAAAEEDEERLMGARTRVTNADQALIAARAERDQARARVNAAQAQVTRERDIAELAQLEDRYRRGGEAYAAMEAARADAALPIDEERLAAIREAAQALDHARVQIEAARPHIRLQALADVRGIIDGTPLQLGPGRSIDQRLGYGMSLELPGVLRMAISSPANAGEWDLDLPAQETRLREMLQAVHVWSIDEAEQLLARRRAAERTIGEQGSIVDAVLQGSTADALWQRVQELRAAVETPLMLEVADAAGAPQALADAERWMLAAEREWEAAHQRSGELEVAVQGLRTEARIAAEEERRLEATLAADRGTWPDGSVEADLANAEAHEATVAQELASAREQLADLAPEEARELHANAQRALVRMERDTRVAQDRLLEVRTRLRDHHEDGVDEELVEARMARDDAADALRRQEAEAATRKLLFETLREERDQASQAYLGPLRKEMERLGRIVFGPSFKVELDGSTLEVVNRTVRGRTVPFESLSIGAQEQIAIIGRLACATIVAPDGGVPVILDDALGNSDKRRVEAMGAVLAAAGRKNQIIVLTCQPDRYEHVGDARVVPLG